MLAADFDAVLGAAARGDERAFERLWRAAQPALLRYLRVLASDPDDVASEVWIEVARGLSNFQGDESGFRAWLFTMARRRALDAHRRSGRRAVRLTDEIAVLDRPSRDDASDHAAERAGTDWAVALIATLPRDQAEVILLRVVAGLSVAEVATMLGRSSGAVRVTAHRGLRTLAGRLALNPVALEEILA